MKVPLNGHVIGMIVQDSFAVFDVMHWAFMGVTIAIAIVISIVNTCVISSF